MRAAILAALVACGGLQPAAAQPVAADGTLPGGTAYRLRSDPTQAVAAIALWFRAPASGFGHVPVPGLSRLAVAAVAGSAPITGTPLAQLVEGYGGRLAVSASPDSVAVTAVVPGERAGAVVHAMTADYFAPVLTPQGLRIARSDVGDDRYYHSFLTASLNDAVGEALFASGPAHDGTYGPERGLEAIPLDGVRAFAERAFRPANAILVLTGNVDAALLPQVAHRAGAAATDKAEAPAVQAPAPPPVAVERAGNLAGLGLGWIGPPIADEASATALDFLAVALFAPHTGAVARTLEGRHAEADGTFVTYRDPGVFVVTITGDDAQTALPLVEAAIAGAAAPMAPDAFAAARAAFVLHELDATQGPPRLAESLGWYAVEGAPQYAPGDAVGGRYFAAISALTPQSVAAAAARYLHSSPAIVTVRRPSRSGGS